MKFSNHTTDTALRDWGSNQAQLPPNNEMLKEQMIGTLPARPHIKLVGPSFRFHIPRLSLVCLGFACLTLFITPDYLIQRFSYHEAFPIYQANPISQFDDFFTTNEAYGLKSTSDVVAMAPNSNGEQSFGLGWNTQTTAAPLTDTREFMKTNYAATINTRDVQKDGDKLKLLIRGYDGRIDTASLGTERGYISFVLPKTAFESFRDSVKEIANGRYLIEQQSDANLLNQKRAIEDQTTAATNSLHNLKDTLERTTTEHIRIIAQLQATLRSYANEKQAIDAQLLTHPDDTTTLEQHLATVNKNIVVSQAQLNTTYAVFASREQSINAQIASAYATISALEEKDHQFVDTIETVTGTISLQWISVMSMIGLYLPKQWLPLSFVLLALVTAISSRHKTTYQEKF